VSADHVGRPTAQSYDDGKRVMILCPHGHLVTTVGQAEFAGGLWEQRVGDPTFTVKCGGAV
jgi:hypothetical protein